MRRAYSVRLSLWVALILLIVVPWTSFVGHVRGHQVGWFPFVSPPIKLRDIVANVLLYVPFGLFFVRRFSGTGIAGATGWALLLSVATEVTQLFSHARFTSATDVVCNVAGAALGASIALARSRGSQ